MAQEILAAADRLYAFFADGGEYEEGHDPEEDARAVRDALSRAIPRAA